MKFDYCIGNPPYQGNSMQQVYPYFYMTGQQIANCVELIFPSAWQQPKNGKNLAKLNKPEYKEDSQIVCIDNRDDCFPNISGAMNVNILLWKKGYNNGLEGKQKIYTNGENPEIKKLLCNVEDIEKPVEIVQLANLITSREDFRAMTELVFAQNSYGLNSNVTKAYAKYGLPPLRQERLSVDDIKVYDRNGGALEQWYIPKDYPLPKTNENMHIYKVLITKVWGNMTSNYVGGTYSDIVVAEPNSICTQTFIENGGFKDKDTAVKYAKYVMTRFCRALLFKNKMSIGNSRDIWKSVPIQTYEEDFWNGSIDEIDNALMDKYNVPEHIRQYVFENIQPRTEKNIVGLGDDNG